MLSRVAECNCRPNKIQEIFVGWKVDVSVRRCVSGVGSTAYRTVRGAESGDG